MIILVYISKTASPSPIFPESKKYHLTFLFNIGDKLAETLV